MVACAALSSLQPPNHLAVSMAACAQTVDELKKRLQTAAENDDQTLCESLLNEVRPLVTSREILEETRIGFVVNQLRKQYFKKWPSLLRISRDVIKSWSDIVCDEVKRPQSGASSRNTTPNVLSPSVAKLMQRGITPNTPAGRRVTSTGLQGSQQRLVSPANGSYAPRSQVSPGEATPIASVTNGMHKSASVGGDLLKHATTSLSTKPITPKENGKRKAVDEALAPSIKRTKTAAGALSVSVSPGFPATLAPQTPTMSVSAARKAVQSTSELFAQMSETLPGHIDIGSDIREHEERVKRELKDEELAHSLQTSASYGNFGSATVERKKRKYERKNQKGTAPNTPAAVASPLLQTTSMVTPSASNTEERLPSLVFRFAKNGVTAVASTPTLTSSSEESKKRKYEKSIRSIPRSTTPPPTVSAKKQEKEREREEIKREKELKEALKRKMEEIEEAEKEDEEEEEVEEKPKPALSKLKNWDSLIPSMEELRVRAERSAKETKKVIEVTAKKTKRDPTKVQLVKNFRRPILILPYLENPTGPDFLLHKYPNSLQYYSEDNFRFGEKRPTA
ncbi:CRE-MDT-26 protein [Caenorhabditis remanei]|uniref:CRE-MDT-26 protein n=2 Tax=Caenorhabditis remanei TaxID=31234 RepID=E3M4T2_CAERE|nr:CRE-MDT-26 protein [Caenorhabditis remanei]